MRVDDDNTMWLVVHTHTHNEWLSDIQETFLLVMMLLTHTRIHAHSHTHTLTNPNQHIHPKHRYIHTQKPTQNQKQKQKTWKTVETNNLFVPYLINASLPPNPLGWWLSSNHSVKFCLPPYAFGGCACVCVCLCDGVYIRAKCLSK